MQNDSTAIAKKYSSFKFGFFRIKKTRRKICQMKNKKMAPAIIPYSAKIWRYSLCAYATKCDGVSSNLWEIITKVPPPQPVKGFAAVPLRACSQYCGLASSLKGLHSCV